MEDQKLVEWRKQIDAIDNQILKLLADRIEIVKQVGKHKLEHNIPFLDPVRKQAVIENQTQKAKEFGLQIPFVHKMFELIHDFGLQTEEEMDE